MQNRAMYPETIHPPIGAYAHAIEVPESAKTMFIAGQVGIDIDGNVPADFAAQADLPGKTSWRSSNSTGCG